MAAACAAVAVLLALSAAASRPIDQPAPVAAEATPAPREVATSAATAAPDTPEPTIRPTPRPKPPTAAPTAPPTPLAEPVGDEAPIQATGSINGHPCGGQLPPCSVLDRESGGDPRVWNGRCYAPTGHRGRSPCGTSSASGLWQFVRGTWDEYGGYLNAADAPPEIQNRKARKVWNGARGCDHWKACGRR